MSNTVVRTVIRFYNYLAPTESPLGEPDVCSLLFISHGICLSASPVPTSPPLARERFAAVVVWHMPYPAGTHALVFLPRLGQPSPSFPITLHEDGSNLTPRCSCCDQPEQHTNLPVRTGTSSVLVIRPKCCQRYNRILARTIMKIIHKTETCMLRAKTFGSHWKNT